jgi:hypothetical protein
VASRQSRRAPHPPIVLIEWHDSQTIASKWTDRDEVRKIARESWPEVIVSVGFLIASTKRYVLISLGTTESPDDVMHSISIPRACIRKLTILKDEVK